MASFSPIALYTPSYIILVWQQAPAELMIKCLLTVERVSQEKAGDGVHSHTDSSPPSKQSGEHMLAIKPRPSTSATSPSPESEPPRRELGPLPRTVTDERVRDVA